MEDNSNIEKDTNESESIKQTSKDLSLLKRILFVVVGVGGLYLFSLIAGLLVSTFNLNTTEEKNGAINFIAYALLFIGLAAVANVDFKKIFNEFKNWLPYVVGIGFGFGLIVFTMVYGFIVNLFYQSSVSENEESLRSFIVVYPLISIIFLGFIGPICEELTYRVGLFGLVKKPKWVAYIIGTAVFALMHFTFNSENIINELINLPVYLVSGFLLCLAYDKFGLAASLTAHTINNVYSVSMVILANFLKLWAKS